MDRSLCQVVGVDLDDDSYFLNLVKMDMITGARLSWWVIGLAKYPPALTGSSISLASEQALALRRWKSLKILKPLHLCRVSQKTHFILLLGGDLLRSIRHIKNEVKLNFQENSNSK